MEIQWSLVLFTALTGAAGWALGCVAVDEFVRKTKSDTNFIVSVAAIVLLAVGGLASVTHLSHPENMLAALSHPTSGIFTEAMLVGLSALFALIYVIVLKRDAAANARKVFALLAAAFGIVLAFASGASYMMSAQIAWDTPLLPLAYGGTAMPLGIAIYLIVASMKHDDDLQLYSLLLIVSGAFAAVTALLYGMVTGVAVQEPLLIWGLAVVVGGIVPLVCGVFARKTPSAALTPAAVAALAALIGCIALRCAMWTTSLVVNNFFGML